VGGGGGGWGGVGGRGGSVERGGGGFFCFCFFFFGAERNSPSGQTGPVFGECAEPGEFWRSKIMEDDRLSETTASMCYQTHGALLAVSGFPTRARAIHFDQEFRNVRIAGQGIEYAAALLWNARGAPVRVGRITSASRLLRPAPLDNKDWWAARTFIFRCNAEVPVLGGAMTDAQAERGGGDPRAARESRARGGGRSRCGRSQRAGGGVPGGGGGGWGGGGGGGGGGPRAGTPKVKWTARI